MALPTVRLHRTFLRIVRFGSQLSWQNILGDLLYRSRFPSLPSASSGRTETPLNGGDDPQFPQTPTAGLLCSQTELSSRRRQALRLKRSSLPIIAPREGQLLVQKYRYQRKYSVCWKIMIMCKSATHKANKWYAIRSEVAFVNIHFTNIETQSYPI